MSEPRDGGPAFPASYEQSHASAAQAGMKRETIHLHGMSLRDWFAGQALALATDPDTRAKIVAEGKKFNIRAGSAVAQFAYEIADLMLAERAQ